MNFDICKKCLGYSIKNKINGGCIFEYDKESTLIGFYVRGRGRKYTDVKIRLKTSEHVQKLLFDNINIFNRETFQKLSLEKILKDVEIICCSGDYKKEGTVWTANLKQCPFQIEHLIHDENRK